MSSKYAIAFGVYLVGLSAHVVAVKATVNEGGPFTIGEMPKKNEPDVWRESRIRVRAALASVGIDTGFAVTFDQPVRHAPGLDLAIFAACFGALGRLPSDWFVVQNHLGAKIFVGELGLNGQVRPVRGVLPILRDYGAAQKEHKATERSFVIPNGNTIEASYVDTGTSTYAITHVSELFDLPAHVVAHREYKPIEVNHFAGSPSALPERVVRAIEVAAIGGHRIAFIGERSFKAARLLCDLLPPMTRDEAIESASVHSIAGLLRNEDKQIGMRPFRAPHHTVNERGLVGGGDPIYPGEVSLAHNGVLYLDSVHEFKRGAIEQLSAVLKVGESKICRAKTSATFPAKPLLVTGCPQRCPCGYIRRVHSAYCTEERRKEWQTRHLETLGIEMIVDVDFIDDDRVCEDPIEGIRDRVAAARKFGDRHGSNSVGKFDRAKVVLTIANLMGSEHIMSEHQKEADRLRVR